MLVYLFHKKFLKKPDKDQGDSLEMAWYQRTYTKSVMLVPPTQQWQSGTLACLITRNARLFTSQKNSKKAWQCSTRPFGNSLVPKDLDKISNASAANITMANRYSHLPNNQECLFIYFTKNLKRAWKSSMRLVGNGLVPRDLDKVSNASAANTTMANFYSPA